MSTTVTLTDVATTTDGGSSMETVLAVIFAGGLAWLAVCKFPQYDASLTYKY